MSAFGRRFSHFGSVLDTSVYAQAAGTGGERCFKFQIFLGSTLRQFLKYFSRLDRDDNEDNFRRQHRIESNGLKQVCRGE